MCVYLLCFDKPISPAHTARHYIGYASDLDSRLAQHAAGRGARLTQVAVERGITWELVRTWEGDRRLERALKERKNARALCPHCNPRGWRRQAAAAADQLELDLDGDPFDLPVVARGMDGLELLIVRGWGGFVGVAPADTEDCDIPY